MAKNDQEDAYERTISAALARTMDLLKFAETKNAALLTFCSAWILAAVNLIVTKSPLPLGYDKALPFAVPVFSLAGMVSIYSLMPKLRPADFLRRKPDAPPLNLLFFGDVARLPVNLADETLRRAYMPTPDRSLTDRYAVDLAAQLAINGRIARRKYQLFNLGATIAGLGVLIVAAPAVLRVLV